MRRQVADPMAAAYHDKPGEDERAVITAAAEDMDSPSIPLWRGSDGKVLSDYSIDLPFPNHRQTDDKDECDAQ